MGLHQKKLPHSEGNLNDRKGQPTERESIFANHIANRVLTSKIYKDLIQLTTNSNKRKNQTFQLKSE